MPFGAALFTLLPLSWPCVHFVVVVVVAVVVVVSPLSGNLYVCVCELVAGRWRWRCGWSPHLTPPGDMESDHSSNSIIDGIIN